MDDGRMAKRVADCASCCLAIRGAYGNYCGSAAWQDWTTGRPIRRFPKTPRWCPGFLSEEEQAEFEATLGGRAKK